MRAEAWSEFDSEDEDVVIVKEFGRENEVRITKIDSEK